MKNHIAMTPEQYARYRGRRRAKLEMPFWALLAAAALCGAAMGAFLPPHYLDDNGSIDTVPCHAPTGATPSNPVP